MRGKEETELCGGTGTYKCPHIGTTETKSITNGSLLNMDLEDSF